MFLPLRVRGDIRGGFARAKLGVGPPNFVRAKRSPGGRPRELGTGLRSRTFVFLFPSGRSSGFSFSWSIISHISLGVLWLIDTTYLKCQLGFVP